MPTGLFLVQGNAPYSRKFLGYALAQEPISLPLSDLAADSIQYFSIEVPASYELFMLWGRTQPLFRQFP